MYLDFIKNVTFNGLTNPSFQFDANGDPLAQYEIVNLQVRQGKKKTLFWGPTDPKMASPKPFFKLIRYTG